MTNNIPVQKGISIPLQNDEERSAQLGNWRGNGGPDKVVLGNNASAPPAREEQETDSTEDGLTGNLMHIIGLPSFCSDLIDEVQLISTIPTDTASTFYDIVNWICGKSEEASPSLETEDAKAANDLAAQKSSESILTSSTSQILTPFGIHYSEDKENQEKNDTILCKLPSELLLPQVPAETKTTLYACEVVEEKHHSNTEETIDNESSDAEKKTSERKVTFAASTSKTEINDANATEPEDQSKKLLAEILKQDHINNNESFIPLPVNRKGYKMREPVRPKLETVLSESLLESSLRPIKSSSQIRIKEQQSEVRRTTSEVQLDLNNHLKSLETIVKQIMQSMDTAGPLTIVANFNPDSNGELHCDLSTSETSGNAEITSPAKKPAFQFLDANVAKNSAAEESEEELGNKPIDLPKEVPRASAAGDHKIVKISEKPRQHSADRSWKSKAQLITNDDSSTRAPKRRPSVSFYTQKNVTMVQNASLRPRTSPNPVGSILDLNNNESPKGISRPPILKQSSMIKLPEKTRTSQSNFALTRSSSVLSGGEDIQRPSTTCNAEQQTGQPKKSSISFKIPASRNPKLHYPSQQRPMTAHNHENFQGHTGDQGWQFPPYLSNQRNMRIVKSCEAHKKISMPEPNNHHHPYNVHQFEQGDFIEETGSEGSAAESTEDSTETEMSLHATANEDTEFSSDCDANRYDLNYRQRSSSRSRRVNKANVIDLTPSISGGQQQHKFHASVFIPPPNSKGNSYSQMFLQKKNQQSTVVVDMTSKKSRSSSRKPEQIQLMARPSVHQRR